MKVVADVFEVVLIDKDGDVAGSTTLQDSNIETSVQESDVRAGRGNQLHGVLHSDRDIALNFTEVAFRYDWLAKQLGQPIVTGAGIGYAMPKWYEVVDDGTGGKQITLDNEPNDPSSVAIYDEGGNKLELTTDFTVTGADVDILDAVISVGDRVEVRTYSYETDPLTQSIEIDNSVFAKGVKAILETVEIETETEEATHRLQWQFDNALPSGNFTISTASAKEASTTSFNLRVVKPSTSNVVGRSLRIPIQK